MEKDVVNPKYKDRLVIMPHLTKTVFRCIIM